MFLPFEGLRGQAPMGVDQGGHPHHQQTHQQDMTRQPGEPTFNDHMNNMHFRANMHDMRDLMKSLAQENETMLNASRSNFVFNRSVYQYNDLYNQFGSSSNFRGNLLGSQSNLGAANLNPNMNPSNSMLQFSQANAQQAAGGGVPGTTNDFQYYYPRAFTSLT